MILNFYTDAGHGWLEVDQEQLISLGIANKISHYSYKKGDFAYLEEDCDASLYLNQLTANGITFSFKEINHPNESPIRNYSPY
jgi:hypothetical protein